MPAAQPVFILAPDALTFAFADPAGGEPVRVFSRPLPPGVYPLGAGDDPGRPESIDVDALRTAVRECAARAGARVRHAWLLLEGPLVRPFSLPIGYRPEDAELCIAVQTEAERYVIFAGTEVAVDFRVTRQEPDKLSMLFAAGRRDVIDAVVGAFAAAGVAIDGVEPLSAALARGVLAGDPAGGLDVTGEPVGVVTLLPRRLDVSTWRNGQPLSWRGVLVDGEALRRGDPDAVADAALELQRTLVDMPVQRWLSVDLPAGLAAMFRQRPGTVLSDRRGAPEGLVVEAARGVTPEARAAFALDLSPPRVVRERRFSNMQLALIAAFGGIAAVLLLSMLALDRQAAARRAELDALNTEVSRRQLAIAAQKQGGAELGGIESAVRGSAFVGMAFDALRSCTPGDAWITDARIESSGQVLLGGVSMGAESPFAMARALAAWPELREVGMPELKRDKIAGKPVYRFRLTARVAGAPDPVPSAVPTP